MFLGCARNSDGSIKFGERSLSVQAGSAAAWKLMLDNQAELLAMQCQYPVSIPEWWPQKAGAHIPQLAVIFRPEGEKSSYTMHIPHYRSENRKPKIPSYKKGNWRGEWVLSDGTKFVINAFDEREANRVWKEVKKLIQSQFLTDVQDNSKPSNGNFKQIVVKPLYADFYAHGYKKLEPEWRAYL